MGVPVRQGADHHPFGLGQRSRFPEPDRSEYVGSLRLWQQADYRLIADSPDRQPQAKERCATADQHLPGRQVTAELAAAIRIELDRAGGDPEEPGLRVEYR